MLNRLLDRIIFAVIEKKKLQRKHIRAYLAHTSPKELLLLMINVQEEMSKRRKDLHKD